MEYCSNLYNCLNQNPDMVKMNNELLSKQQFSSGVYEILKERDTQTSVNIVYLSKVPGSDEALLKRQQMGATQGSEEDYDILFEEDVDVIDQDTGNCVMRFRKNVFPEYLTQLGRNKYLKVGLQKGRAGKGRQGQGKKRPNSGIMGSIDAKNKASLCRTTAFSYLEPLGTLKQEND